MLYHIRNDRPIVLTPTEVLVMAKGNNSQGKEKKKPKKGAKPAPVKSSSTPKR
jgi:hypothetical protein